MSALISLLLVWFIISIPVAFFVATVFSLSNKSDVDTESISNQSVDVHQDTMHIIN